MATMVLMSLLYSVMNMVRLAITNYDNVGRLLTQQNSSELVCYSYGP